jgi:predicted nucleic acid-binding protein
MGVYLDASVLLPIFIEEARSARVDAFLGSCEDLLIVSDVAAAEFAAALGHRARSGDITVEEAHGIFAAFDAWSGRATERAELTSLDVGAAEGFLRLIDLALRLPDALNLALAIRLGAALATFDDRMALAARSLSAPLAEI